MATHILQQVRNAIASLNPNEIRSAAERPLRIGMIAPSEAAYQRIEMFLCPAEISEGKYRECADAIHRLDAPDPAFDAIIHDASLGDIAGSFAFSPASPDATLDRILEAKEDLGLPLARYFCPFRRPVVDRIIQSIAKENALFALATAIPNVVPGITSLPWAAAEFGSDTAVLTVNQVRMAFMIAAALDREAGYSRQKSEIASIIAGAFGWRAVARELVGKVPFGGGVIPKAAISYAGTYVVGLSLERLYRIGQSYTRQERKAAYEDAFARGKAIAGTLLERIRPAAGRRN